MPPRRTIESPPAIEPITPTDPPPAPESPDVAPADAKDAPITVVPPEPAESFADVLAERAATEPAPPMADATTLTVGANVHMDVSSDTPVTIRMVERPTDDASADAVSADVRDDVKANPSIVPDAPPPDTIADPIVPVPEPEIPGPMVIQHFFHGVPRKAHLECVCGAVLDGNVVKGDAPTPACRNPVPAPW